MESGLKDWYQKQGSDFKNIEASHFSYCLAISNYLFKNYHKNFIIA